MKAPISSKEEVIGELLAHRRQLKDLGVEWIGLFGSFIRNTEIRVDSDVDLFIDFNASKKNFDNFMNLSFYLEDLFGRKVDIVTPQSLSKYIGPHILKHLEYVPF